MGIFALNLVLAIIWVGLTGGATTGNFMGGFGVGFLILWLVEYTIQPETGDRGYVATVGRLLRFIPYFFYTLMAANYNMAIAVLSPLRHLNPGVVSVELDIKNPTAITLLANWITLTPGTLTLDISDDRRTLLVHTYDIGADVDAFRQQIKTDYESRITELFGNA